MPAPARTRRPAAAPPSSLPDDGGARRAYDDAIACDAAGDLAEARRLLGVAADRAEHEGDLRLRAEVLQRLARVEHRSGDAAAAEAALRGSLDAADRAGDDGAAAEALSGIGKLAIDRDALDEARDAIERALARGGEAPGLRAHAEQNLGVIANIHGELEDALAHYERSLGAFDAMGDVRGCARAFNNLGMLSADMRRWDDADRYFRQGLALAERAADAGLRGICLVNHTEVLLERRLFDEARRHASESLRIFDSADGARGHKSAAYRALGVVYRETGRPVLAEARLRAAVDLAIASGSTLLEAEASRELALLFQSLGRNQDALRLLNTAHRLFMRLGARADMRDIGAKVADLEGTYLAVVRDWGQSIESADSYTHGHCERVATYAVDVARALGFDDDALTTMRLGAYLHDVGKVKIPHEILNKPGRLTDEEFGIMKQHTVWGVELLAGIEFPWDIKPMIRSHHEKMDGTGYPDRLKGDEIPISAQIICVADVYDALTTTRSYRPAMTHAEAVAEMARTRHWWRPDVYAAFEATVATGAGAAAA
jgi:putative nucleotidyltransferase with HDIG domain